MKISKLYHSPLKNFTKSGIIDQNSVILSKYDVKVSKVNQVIYFSAIIRMSNMKAVTQILFEIFCTQDFQISVSRGASLKRGMTLT